MGAEGSVICGALGAEPMLPYSLSENHPIILDDGCPTVLGVAELPLSVSGRRTRGRVTLSDGYGFPVPTVDLPYTMCLFKSGFFIWATVGTPAYSDAD